MKLDRRQAVALVGTVVGFVHGTEVVADNQSRGLTLALDAVDAIVLRYRGQTVVVSPAEVMEALGAAPGHPPFPGQYSLPKGK